MLAKWERDNKNKTALFCGHILAVFDGNFFSRSSLSFCSVFPQFFFRFFFSIFEISNHISCMSHEPHIRIWKLKWKTNFRKSNFILVSVREEEKKKKREVVSRTYKRYIWCYFWLAAQQEVQKICRFSFVRRIKNKCENQRK